jgi:hypothetical protein
MRFATKVVRFPNDPDKFITVDVTVPRDHVSK